MVAFDPLCKYVPGCEITNPGQKWNNVQSLQEDFPDVFKCYQLPIPDVGGTIFRFPLRKEIVCNGSDYISNNVVTCGQMLDLFQVFKEAMGECLLFLNNITEIKLSEINNTGRLHPCGEVNANMSDESVQVRKSFSKHLKQAANYAKENNILETEVSKHVYEVEIKRKFKKCKWLVVQQIGFESPSIGEEFSEMYKTKKASLVTMRWCSIPDIRQSKGNPPLQVGCTVFSLCLYQYHIQCM